MPTLLTYLPLLYAIFTGGVSADIFPNSTSACHDADI